KQPHAQGALERGDGATQRGLRHAEHCRCATEISVLDDCHEALELAQVKHQLSFTEGSRTVRVMMRSGGAGAQTHSGTRGWNQWPSDIASWLMQAFASLRRRANPSTG